MVQDKKIEAELADFIDHFNDKFSTWNQPSALRKISGRLCQATEAIAA
jgi:hypothetical protein